MMAEMRDEWRLDCLDWVRKKRGQVEASRNKYLERQATLSHKLRVHILRGTQDAFI